MSRRNPIRKALFNRDGNRCTYCQITLSHKTATIDHVKPRSKGGFRKSLSNLVLCCQPCNEAKANKPVSEFGDRLQNAGGKRL